VRPIQSVYLAEGARAPTVLFKLRPSQSPLRLHTTSKTQKTTDKPAPAAPIRSEAHHKLSLPLPPVRIMMSDQWQHWFKEQTDLRRHHGCHEEPRSLHFRASRSDKEMNSWISYYVSDGSMVTHLQAPQYQSPRQCPGISTSNTPESSSTASCPRLRFTPLTDRYLQPTSLLDCKAEDTTRLAVLNPVPVLQGFESRLKDPFHACHVLRLLCSNRSGALHGEISYTANTE
jgi:hypothetical protein